MELFLTLEDENETLVGYARLRDPGGNPTIIRKELLPHIDNLALLRELKVVGPMERLGEHSEEKLQHTGFGNQLLAECERYAREVWAKIIVFVTSGIGVRQYYRRRGYQRNGAYMAKHI